MPPNCRHPYIRPYLRRATTSVLLAVALVSGGILLLGDRFDAAPGYALPARLTTRMAACVAEENMRLIDPGQEQCRFDEIELGSGTGVQSVGPGPGAPGPVNAGLPEPAGPPGPAGRPGADGVSGYEIVTAKVAVPSRQAASGEARCPAGKVALGGGVLPDRGEPFGQPDKTEDRMQLVVSAPLLPGGDGGGSGWTATVKNTSAGSLSVLVAAVCVAVR